MLCLPCWMGSVTSRLVMVAANLAVPVQTDPHPVRLLSRSIQGYIAVHARRMLAQSSWGIDMSYKNQIKKVSLAKSVLLACGPAIGLSVLTGSAIAHHSVAAFDMQKTVTIEGTVEKLEWTNPHMWLWVVVNRNGQTESWSVEAASPANMTRRAGWNKRSVMPGEKVQVDVHPFRDGRPGGALAKVTKADGSVLGSGGGGPPSSGPVSSSSPRSAQD